MPGPRLLFVVTEDWYFWSHRAGLARAARDAGFDVLVATRVRDHGAAIAAEGFKLIPVRELGRGRPGPRDVGAIAQLLRVCRRERPDIVHHVSLKPVVYGSLAARLARVPAVVNAVTGLGHAFIDDGTEARLLRGAATVVMRATLSSRNSRTIFQNGDDAEHFIRKKIVDRRRVVIIRGSGVDATVFTASDEPSGIPVVLLASRMLWEKGVGEFVEAAKLLARRGARARFVLVGPVDPDNPAGIRRDQLQQWVEEGAVEWWGYRPDMAAVLASSNLVVLPSYREGLPKVLLEAAACGRALVGTDVPGCREIVREGVNGALVPPGDARALARAIAGFLEDPAKRALAGRRSREIATGEFSLSRVVQETLAVYRDLLSRRESRSLARAKG